MTNVLSWTVVLPFSLSQLREELKFRRISPLTLPYGLQNKGVIYKRYGTYSSKSSCSRRIGRNRSYTWYGGLYDCRFTHRHPCVSSAGSCREPLQRTWAYI